MIYAITEIVIFLLVAAMLGLVVGYLLWYRRAARADAEADNMAVSLQDRTVRLAMADQDVSSLIDERDRIRAEALSLANAADRSAAEVTTLRGHLSQIQPLADRVPEMRSKLDHLTEEVEALRAERDRLAIATVGTLSQAEVEAMAPSSEQTSTPSPSFVGDEPVDTLKANPDDLQRIIGIGPHLEQVLNENGIYTYRQIARLTEVGLRDLDDQLGFKGRIERDNWSEQAEELHGEKFGKDPA